MWTERPATTLTVGKFDAATPSSTSSSTAAEEEGGAPVVVREGEGRYTSSRATTTTTTTTTTTFFSLSTHTAAIVVMVLFLACLFIPLYLIFKQGRVQPGSWPMISDMWVYPPSDWISRWGVVQGVTLAIWSHITLYQMDGDTSKSAKSTTSLALIAILGLAVVGCVNETENYPLHITGAFIFFVGYDVYMMIRSITMLTQPASAYSEPRPTKCIQLFLLLVAIVSTVLTILRFTLDDGKLANIFATPSRVERLVAGMNNGTRNGTSSGNGTASFAGGVGGPQDVVVPLIEWFDALTILTYMMTSVLAYGNVAKKYGLAVKTTAPTSSASSATSGAKVVQGTVAVRGAAREGRAAVPLGIALEDGGRPLLW